MTSHCLIYFECLDRPLDADYKTPFDHMEERKSIELMSLDNYSQADQFALASRLVDDSEHSLLVINSSKGSGSKGLVALIHKVADKKGLVIWVGEHSMRQKTIAISKGKITALDNLPAETKIWINQS